MKKAMTIYGRNLKNHIENFMFENNIDDYLLDITEWYLFSCSWWFWYMNPYKGFMYNIKLNTTEEILKSFQKKFNEYFNRHFQTELTFSQRWL